MPVLYDGPRVDITNIDLGEATIVERMRRVEKVVIRAGVVKSRPYPDRPKVDVATVAAVQEHRTRWLSEAIDRNATEVQAIPDLVAEVISNPAITDGRQRVRTALKRLRALMRQSIQEKGLVRTGFLLKNVKYKLLRGKNLEIVVKKPAEKVA